MIPSLISLSHHFEIKIYLLFLLSAKIKHYNLRFYVISHSSDSFAIQRIKPESILDSRI
ncbi:hypothetical protein [Helicobacter fennelliae]|uniref:hypothetical protein n=1 Tax=Helicobacter fennelliae TaxID=215 RepID=UPI001F1C1F36|nr:hypothetical protein [Helicobacter fennelliae]